jgi:hypothetical protein
MKNILTLIFLLGFSIIRGQIDSSTNLLAGFGLFVTNNTYNPFEIDSSRYFRDKNKVSLGISLVTPSFKKSRIYFDFTLNKGSYKLKKEFDTLSVSSIRREKKMSYLDISISNNLVLFSAKKIEISWLFGVGVACLLNGDREKIGVYGELNPYYSSPNAIPRQFNLMIPNINSSFQMEYALNNKLRMEIKGGYRMLLTSIVTNEKNSNSHFFVFCGVKYFWSIIS